MYDWQKRRRAAFKPVEEMVKPSKSVKRVKVKKVCRGSRVKVRRTVGKRFRVNKKVLARLVGGERVKPYNPPPVSENILKEKNYFTRR